jgi:hypothetical protein
MVGYIDFTCVQCTCIIFIPHHPLLPFYHSHNTKVVLSLYLYLFFVCIFDTNSAYERKENQEIENIKRGVFCHIQWYLNEAISRFLSRNAAGQERLG